MHRKSVVFATLITTLLLSRMVANPVLAVSPNIAIYSDQYRSRLEKYRLQNDKTVVSLQQYANLRTLASQEEAVQSMRDFLLIRADVVTAHLDILSETLGDRSTIDPAWSASASALLVQAKAGLAEHHARSDIAVDRIKADAEAVWFQKDQTTLFMAADRTQSMIGMGRVEEAVAALETTKQKIDAWIATASMSETQRVEKRRGSDELGRTIAAAQQSIADAKGFYKQITIGSSTALAYPRVRPTLVNAYTHVVRGVGFAKELTQ